LFQPFGSPVDGLFQPFGSPVDGLFDSLHWITCTVQHKIERKSPMSGTFATSIFPHATRPRI
jgi:hypothetical protein